ncbi:MAG: STAS domain-containing protein [Betaproteobacteria bacterium]
MAIFSKPPAKKPEAPKIAARPAVPARPAQPPVSAREVAVQAQGRRGPVERPRAEPAGDISVTGASLIEWSPARTSIEVAQTSPGLCAVLENAALLYASGQSKPARDMLEEGVQHDPDAKASPLAWLALFDLMQRGHDRVGFERVAMTYVMQFERSAPMWDESGPAAPAPAAAPRSTGGGYIALTGKLTQATAPQIEALRNAAAKGIANARLDLAQVAGFDDAGARLLADALAEVRKRRLPLLLERADKVRAALDILIRRGRDGGEGVWLLCLELLQFQSDQDAFDNRAIEYAIAFEQSPPSWDPPPALPGDVVKDTAAVVADEKPPSTPSGARIINWSGVLIGQGAMQIAGLSEYALNHAVVPIDMTAVERIDFVCAGALFNAINRIESQRKAVQIVGATPIIRALLLLIGISPRHFVKKPQ